jgi:UDP-glucose 4-epimerase
MRVLVTGGTGYIGSHTVVELLAAGHEAVIVDNLCHSKRAVLEQLHKITGVDVPFYELDVTDLAAMTQVAETHQFDAVIHFAGLKAVDTSVAEPVRYYQNNLESTLVVARVAADQKIPHIIFSSSATVYGDPESVPIPETAKLHATNPYGQTKLMSEQILTDVAKTGSVKVTLLRYFNPIGAHESGLIGEDPTQKPDNLVPLLDQVAVGIREKIMVFGDDWPTPDGTGIRDYVHVVDLAKGHVAALAHPPKAQVDVYNLGTGKGSSVKEVIAAYEKASGKTLNKEVSPRRPGDIAECYADVSKAARELEWKAEFDLDRMCRDSWNWRSNNPNGLSD